MSCTKPTSKPISLYAQSEQIAANALANTLPLQIAMMGVDVIHKRPINRLENNLYGKGGGSPVNARLKNLGSEKILMGASHWRVIDGNELGYLDQPGYMYCTFDLEDNDVLTVVRSGDKGEIDFTAINVEAIGNTVTILKRFLMSNINGS